MHTLPTLFSERTGSSPRADAGRRPARHQLTRLEGIILFACLASVVLAFAAGSRSATAPSVQTVSVRVDATQTLWDLASAHPIEGLTTAQTVEHIKAINGLSTSQLLAGQTLDVPASATTDAAMTAR